ncbi:MAG TPA: hypothetical protein VH575_04420 [Gemmataceae bacterium]|jgi:hypothetical protein
MKKLFGVALLALPLLAASAHANGSSYCISAHANGSPFSIQAGGGFYIKGGPGPAYPQAGPWYLYWPIEAHPVPPAPTGYPYWPNPMGLPTTSFGGPSSPPGTPVAPPPATNAPSATTPAPAPQAAPQGAPQAAPKPAPQNSILPPYLQPTACSPVSYTGQAPSYWYDR